MNIISSSRQIDYW